MKLGRDDLVLFYTDALTEAADASGRLLGESGLLEAARRLDPATGSPLAIGSVAARFRGAVTAGRQQADDDVTLVVLHHDASPSPRLSLGEKLDVYAKVFGLKTV